MSMSSGAPHRRGALDPVTGEPLEQADTVKDGAADTGKDGAAEVQKDKDEKKKKKDDNWDFLR